MKLVQPSFAKGEIAPDLYGRVDIREYETALKRARNIVIHQFGGASNRPGMIFIANVKDPALTPRLLPFKFKTTDTHVIEFGHQYIRVLRDDAHVTEAAKNITGATQANPVVLTIVGHGYTSDDEVLITGVGGMTQLNGRRFRITKLTVDTVSLQDPFTDVNIDGTTYTAYTAGGISEKIFTLVTPYQQSELRDVQYTQSADVMTLVHPDHPPRELQRLAVNNWQLVDIAFQPTIAFPQNLATSGGAGGVDSFYNVTAIADNGEESLPAIAATAHVITAITQTNPATITSAAHGFSDGDIIHLQDIIGMTQLNNRRFSITNSTVNTFDLLGENSTTYTPYSSGGNAYATYIFNTNSTTVTLTWDAVVGAVRYRVFKKSSGVFGFIASTDAPTFVVAGTETPDLGDTPPRLVEPFLGTNNRPRAVGFYQQRMVMGGSNNKPDTSYYSVTGNFHNFSHAIPIRADDGFSATLNSGEVNVLSHYVSIKDLLMMTSGQEWIANGSNGDARFSIDTIQQKPQTNWGSCNIPPITVGQTVLFVEPTANRVRSSAFSFADDHYVAEDLSIFAPHLMEGHQILEWGMVKTPDPIIYMIRDDGQLLLLSYNEEQKVLAWATWDTLGDYKSVATIRPTATSTNEEAYFVVKRKINGFDVEFIERTHERFFSDVRDCFFVDAGLSLDAPCMVQGITFGNPTTITCSGHGFVNGDEVDLFDFNWQPTFDLFDNEVQPDQLNTHRYVVSNVTANTFTIDVNSTAFSTYRNGGTARKAVSTVTGLYHIPNTAVSVLADGNVLTGLVTSSTGSLNLPRKFSRVHVGLKYISDIATLKPEPLSRGHHSAQGSQFSIDFVTLRLKNTRGVFIGPDENNLIEMKQRDAELMGDPTDLFNGDKQISLMAPPYDSSGVLFLRQRYPLPFSLLALVSDIDFGDR